MEYQDFVVLLDRDPKGQGILTRVIRSPAGEAEAPFINPVSPAELDRIWQAAFTARQEERSARDLRPRTSQALDSWTAELSLERLGARLFKELIAGPVHNCWVHSMAAVRSTEKGLRLKLQLDLTDPLLSPLAELPWEYLFSMENGGFIGLQRKTPILRHMRLPMAAGSPPEAHPLRLLVVSSQPRSMSHLSLEDERGKISETLGTLSGVETLPLYNPDIETLRDVLLQQKFHVFHFMGHGGFDSRSGQGVLYFADSHGDPVPVTGSLLASHLAGHDSLRLVFLNACDTARTHSGAPFAGVATALLRAGVPAVLAMQRPIRDGSALELSRTVYRRLALGDPIDAAVTEGRLAIARGHGALLEWGTPVLFSRVEDGRLFAPEPVSAASEPPSSPHPRRSAPLLLAGIVVAVGLGIAAVQWPFSPSSPAGSSPSDARVELEQKPAPDTTFPESTGSKATDPEPTPTPPQEKAPEIQRASVLQPPVESERSAPEEPKRTVATAPLSYEVGEGSTAFIPDLEAEVGATFFEREGHSFARFWVTPRDTEMLKQTPIMSPQSIEFPSPSGGKYRLTVQSLDFETKRAKVRLSFVP